MTQEPPQEPNSQADLVAATKALVTLLVWVACADGVAAEEIAVLEAMIREEAALGGISVDDETIHAVAAHLAEMQPNGAMVDDAAKSIIDNDGARERLGRWVRQMTFADGEGSDQERIAIARMADAFVRARPAGDSADVPASPSPQPDQLIPPQSD